MPNGSTITYTVTVTIPSGRTGNLVNTATVTAPSGVVDAGGNNSATDTDTQNSTADLSITKDDGSLTYIPGTSTTYTVTVSNAGPSNVTGATVTDNIPTGTPGVIQQRRSGGASNFSASGTGSISDVVTMPNGSTITYTITVSIPSGRTGNLVNTATVTAPSGVVMQVATTVPRIPIHTNSTADLSSYQGRRNPDVYSRHINHLHGNSKQRRPEQCHGSDP